MRRPPGDEPLEFQRKVRHDLSEPERRLWNVIRNRQVAGAKFRKQTWIGAYLVDFYCAEAKLVIEVDGDSHAHQQAYDERRTAWLEAKGFRVMRFSNLDVTRNLEGVVVTIHDALTLPPGDAGRAPPSPLQGEVC